MSHDQLSSPATSVIAAPVAERLAALGPPPLIEGEDGAAYDELLLRISTAVKPADIIEDFWVRDITDLVWEAVRLRRLKVNLMKSTAYKGLRGVGVAAWGIRICCSGRDSRRPSRRSMRPHIRRLTIDAVMACDIVHQS
jgi:hypothetical protein